MGRCVNKGVTKEVRQSQSEGGGRWRCNINRRRGKQLPEPRKEDMARVEEGYTKGKQRRSSQYGRRTKEGSALTWEVVAPRRSIQSSCGSERGSRGCQRSIWKSENRRRSAVMGVQSIQTKGFM